MNHRATLLAAGGALALLALALALPEARARGDLLVMEPAEARAELDRATRESRLAEARATRFAETAAAAGEAAERTAREAAALAARIQQAEAEISAARARFSLAQAAREALAARLAQRREPLVRLTGALQTNARRPLALAALQPGSLEDLVHVRAVLETAVPEIRRRTASLRAEIEQGEALERRAARALAALERSERQLEQRRAELAALETRQRLAGREARRNALREEERALALAEEARDLDGLVDRLGEAAALRRELAALPGPVPRPAAIGEPGATSRVAEPPPPPPPPTPAPAATGPPRDFRLPVQGRTLAGFGERRESGLASTGITLLPAPGAQVVAPATGRVAFAGPYRGYGRIVIIEHDGGWTSLVTGLARAEVPVGARVIGGSPLGTAQAQGAAVTIELRRDGEPVNPLEYLG
ncbi:murein hydrolase activator EnvC [Erythrobacter sp. HL-111]|uniref:murein hydrolase activator EnvC family protein n=1 Tax=Erythrobacter sp. HL-111 TaxID=1798193 RepID=UPI0006DA0A8A|nr:peptidoglycan DD-metalloendopeptidase family protein [Erythrobacter sp. HL-111]KPP95495.1 MAG: Membrane-bound metallopeptidase [Erythrobacteraceae bacterium HL-111]SDS73367.1 Septal ring factor EnvC, activator of murein hydrolases AmiA and AmiB [Erythrobacter sp. HL-111]